MKKKEMEIGKNVSSGAEKVEVIEEKTESKQGKDTVNKKTKTTKRTAGVTLGKDEKTAQAAEAKAEKERKAAEARVNAALKKQERKEKRKVLKEARLAKLKELREKRKAEKEEKIRERAHAKANRKQAEVKRRKELAAKKEQARKQRKQRRDNKEKGYGGWIAAVVSLGVVTLALATTVTVGAVEMSKNNEVIMASYKGTVYELTELIENVDEDLERVRLSNSPAQQSRILTDVLVQARLAELDLEKMPFSIEQDENITRFINNAAAQSERMLSKLRRGEPLSEEDRAMLERIYETNHAIRMELDKMLSETIDKDWSECIKKGTGKVTEGLKKLEEATLEENRATFKMPKFPKFDMPNKGGENKQTMPAMPSENTGEGIQPARAEELCKGYFQDYGIQEFKCVGESVGRRYRAYNVQGNTENGAILFAEIEKESGRLLGFDFYEDCAEEKFDLDNCKRIAENFLEKLGYADMEVARFRKNGTTTDFMFVYEDDDVMYYPQTVQVKVCGTRGIVSGMDATKYMPNEKGRYAFTANLSMGEAKERLYKELTVESARPAVINTARGPKSAYEFLCSYDEGNYFVYIDANSGDEISIINAKGIM